MKILTKLTKRNLLLNKKRTISSIIGIMLSVALICAVSGMFTSFKETLIQDNIAENGYYHIVVNSISKEQLSKYEHNKDVKKVNVIYELGVSSYKKIEKEETNIFVYSTDNNTFNNLAYKLVDGVFPKTKDEIVLRNNLALNYDLKIGDFIELNIIDAKTNESIIKKYKIVGFFTRKESSFGEYGITTDETTNNIKAFVALKNPKDYKQSFTELLGANNYNDIASNRFKKDGITYSINHQLLMWEAFAFSDTTSKMMIAVMSVVISIIVAVSIFCIRNSFAIGVTEKIKMYGMLSSVGATKNQIKKSVILEGLILGLIGVPLGILCGVLATFILTKVVNILIGDFLLESINGLVFKMNYVDILLSVCLGFVTIYLSSISSAKRASLVSPIENLKNAKDIKITNKKMKTPKIIKKIFKTSGVIAYKNLKRSKKKYKTTVISLTISIFAFISLAYFITETTTQAARYYKNYDYNIMVYLNMSKSNEKQVEKIKKLNNINKSYVIYDSTGSAKVTDKEMINKYEDYEPPAEGFSINLKALDDDTFKDYVKKLNLNYEEVKKDGILIDEFELTNRPNSKRKVVRRYKYNKGDTMNLEYRKDGIKEYVSIRLMSVNKNLPVGLEGYVDYGGIIVVNEKYYNEFNFTPFRLVIDANKPYEVSKELKEIDKELVFYNYEEQAKRDRAISIVISIFLYGFIVVITLIGVTNIFNVLTSNMQLRQNEFAMLKSVGMTKKEFNRMINLEVLFYSSKSLIYGCILGILGSYLIHTSYSEKLELPYHLPLGAIIISVVFVFIIVYTIMRYSIKKINKQNIIETIRKETI